MHALALSAVLLAGWIPSTLPAAAPATAPTSAPALAGKWLGQLKSAPYLLVGFEIQEDKDGRYQAVLDSPLQGAMGIPAGSVTLTGDRIRIDAKDLGVAYEGRIQPSGNSIQGTFIQDKKSGLDLKRVDRIELAKRPQTPHDPNPYRSEQVTYPGPEPGMTLAGTLTIPQGTGPFPAVLLISGAGPADRDEEILGHRPFKVLADYMTRLGIAVLRVDKRGIGKSTGQFQGFAGATIEEYAADALAGLAFLNGRPEIDSRHIGLVGHSEGGEVAPAVAVRAKDVSFIALLAGPGLSNFETLVLQDGTEAQKAGASKAEMALIRQYSRRFYSIIRDEPDAPKAKDQIEALQKGLTKAEQRALAWQGWPKLEGSLNPESAQDPTFRAWLGYDTSAALRKVVCPVLALNGDKDCQVPFQENLDGIRRSLEAGGNRAVKTVVMPGLNHLFQTCTTGAESEYGLIEETLSSSMLKTLSDWVQAQVSRP